MVDKKNKKGLKLPIYCCILKRLLPEPMNFPCQGLQLLKYQVRKNIKENNTIFEKKIISMQYGYSDCTLAGNCTRI